MDRGAWWAAVQGVETYLACKEIFLGGARNKKDGFFTEDAVAMIKSFSGQLLGQLSK